MNMPKMPHQYGKINITDSASYPVYLSLIKDQTVSRIISPQSFKT